MEDRAGIGACTLIQVSVLFTCVSLWCLRNSSFKLETKYKAKQWQFLCDNAKYQGRKE